MTVKALQKQLIAAVAMVLVAVIAVSGSTFAWFAQNTSVTAQTITATAESTELLRISKTNSGYSTSVELNLTVDDFRPVSAGATLVKAGTFYKDNGWEDETVTETSDAHTLASKFGTATAGTDYAVADLWITDNVQADVYFSKKTNIIAKTTVAVSSGDPVTTTEYDVYAQFVAGAATPGTVVLAKNTALTFAADGVTINNTSLTFTNPSSEYSVTEAAKTKLTNALGALRLTFAPYETAVAEEVATTTSSEAAKFYSFSSSTAGKYNTQSGTAGTNVDGDKRIASVDGTGAATLEADSTTLLSNTQQLTSLSANEAKHYKVYCYLEGCDKQCITGIADDVVYTVSLGFAQASGQ